MDKLKVAVINGPKEILAFLGDDIQEAECNSAEVIIMAGDKDISPEYCGQTAKDSSRHNPLKDYMMIRKIKQIHETNRRALIVGIRNDATFIDVIRGGRLIQKNLCTSEEMEVMTEFGPSHFFCGNTRFKVPSFETYITERTNGSTTLYTGSRRSPYSVIVEYGNSSDYNAMISIHIDPLLMRPDDIRNKILRCYIKKRFTNTYNENRFTVKAEEAQPSNLSDASIWSCEGRITELGASLNQRACFGQMVKGSLSSYANYGNKETIKWEIHVMKPKAWYGKYGRCVTFFKPEEYKEYYDRLAKLYEFEYDIDDSNKDYVKITIKAYACCAWHKFILTQIRYIYQYCMHYILFDTLRLKEMEEFADMDILDIMNVVAKTCTKILYQSNEYMFYGYYDDSMYSGKILKPINDEEFRQTFNSYCKATERPQLNCIAESMLIDCPDGFKYIDNDLPFSCSWLVFTETFGKRFNTYKNNLKIFKNLIK